MDINYQDYDGYGYNSNTNLISAKEDLNKKLSSMQGEIDTSTKEIENVLKDAPETLDTLKEVADKFESLHIDEIETELEGKADTSYVDSSILNLGTTIRSALDNQVAWCQNLENDIATKADNARIDYIESTFLPEHYQAKGDYATVEYVDEQDAALSDAISSKADASDVYTQAQCDEKFITSQSLDGYATVEAMNNGLATKADTDSVYSKGEVDSVLSEKANASDVYVKDDVYTKGETDEIVAASDEALNGQISQLLTRIENLEQVNSVAVVDDTIANVPAGSNVVVTSAEAVQSMTGNTEFNTITIVGGNTNKDVKAIAAGKVTIDGMTVNGEKGASNGRMQLSANTVTLKNISIESGSTAYNVFESSQNTSKSEYFTKEFNVSGLNVDNTLLNHNVVNIYTFADDAVVNFKDSYLNLDVDNSNALRLANYSNATGVTVNFENVTWTYENAEGSDWAWAGLVIYQPAGSDAALNGDYSKLATWKFNFKNCKYNDEVVNAVNFGNHNQVIYGYNLNKSGNVSDISQITGLTITFE